MSAAPVLFDRAQVIVRKRHDTDESFALRVDRAAEILRELAVDQHPGRHPKIVVHFDEPRTEAVINCTVVW